MFDILAKPIQPTFILERVKSLMSGGRVAVALTD
jgi:hypothetical protein